MTWRQTLAQAIGQPWAGPARAEGDSRPQADDIDIIDKTTAAPGSVNIVSIVDNPPELRLFDGAGASIPPMTLAQGHEADAWPPVAQRAWVGLLDLCQAQGLPLAQAEGLSFAVVKRLLEALGRPN